MVQRPDSELSPLHIGSGDQTQSDGLMPEIAKVDDVDKPLCLQASVVSTSHFGTLDPDARSPVDVSAGAPVDVDGGPPLAIIGTAVPERYIFMYI
jgi:hypothetical protein